MVSDDVAYDTTPVMACKYFSSCLSLLRYHCQFPFLFSLQEHDHYVPVLREDIIFYCQAPDAHNAGLVVPGNGGFGAGD